MGLSVDYGCFQGSYSSFNEWRNEISKLLGYGDILKREGFGGNKNWDDLIDDPIYILLYHSDCDGVIKLQESKLLVNRLQTVYITQLENEIDRNPLDYYWYGSTRTKKFIDGLISSIKSGDDIYFH